ncbi:hypothetical protein LZZ50_08175 [Xanthomonas arboricola]|uniref:hypothetical protein n=2 Tax=Xanthomonas arboricola TaxID=56448 RepID=UPI001FD64FCE|nr:hypothetical protein [Xanthomonas arboricola]UOT00292.1 hypothetical protein LZZ50_08175 [Xanthomonas arboricola]
MRNTTRHAGMLRCTWTTSIDSDDRAPFFDEFSVTSAQAPNGAGATHCICIALRLACTRT